FRREGRPIRRSSHVLVEGATSTSAVYTASELFHELAGEDAVVVAHVGGRYADIKCAHDGRLERSVEVHSAWGTFEWLLHDAFAQGYRLAWCVTATITRDAPAPRGRAPRASARSAD